MPLRRRKLKDRQQIRYICAVLLTAFVTLPALADLGTSQQIEDAARKIYNEKFYRFTQDKNVMGKAQSATGDQSGGGKKVRFDHDDAVAYESDLTYHDLSFRTSEDDPSAASGSPTGSQPQRDLFEFVSPHGKLTSAGGSSLLERTMYQQHDKFVREEKNKPPDPNNEDKPGIKFKSAFKIETKDVVDKNPPSASSPPGGPAKPPEKLRVERVTLRDETKRAVEDVGQQSFETVKRAARDEDRQTDDSALPNLTFLYEAAGRGIKAWWDSALANLTQRRVNDIVPNEISPGNPNSGKVQLNENFAKCDTWSAAAAQQALAQITDPRARKALQDRIDKMSEECKQVTSLPYNTVNPQFETDAKGNTQLKAGNPRDEDSISRDLRNQLTVMANPRAKLSDLKSNWEYNPEEAKVNRTRYDDKGNASGQYQETMGEAMDKYNQKLEDAAQAYDAAKARFPDLQVNKNQILSNRLTNENVFQVDKPTTSQMEELGAKAENPQIPTSYDNLVKEADQLNGQ